jgi:ribosomal protein S20
MNNITAQERVTKNYEKEFDAALTAGDKKKARQILRDWQKETEKSDVMDKIYKEVRL